VLPLQSQQGPFTTHREKWVQRRDSEVKRTAYLLEFLVIVLG
jgi:hypothetical protein